MHHQRKKSGHASANTSMTDVRRAVTATDTTRYKRPTTLSRRTTPVSAQKLGRSQRDREREWRDSTWDHARESFPQFCMICEKQFLPHNDSSLYCSEECRKHDQSPTTSHASLRRDSSNGYTHHPVYAEDQTEYRDIIPRASPSRPSSTYFSPPTTPGNVTSPSHSSAISALRSLTVQPPSPPSPTISSPNLWPFSKGAPTSPPNSWSRGGAGYLSSTHDGGYGASGYGYNYQSNGTERPLPSRTLTGYSRPKSIELVTPMVGR